MIMMAVRASEWAVVLLVTSSKHQQKPRKIWNEKNMRTKENIVLELSSKQQKMFSMQISFLNVFTQIIFCFFKYFRLEAGEIWTFDGKVTRCLQRREEGTQWDSSATHNRIRHSFRSYTWSKCENGGDDLIPAAFPGGLDRLHTPTWASFISSDKKGHESLRAPE